MDSSKATFLGILVNAVLIVHWRKLNILVKLQGFHPKETQLKFNVVRIVGSFAVCSQGKMELSKTVSCRKIPSLQKLLLSIPKSYFGGELLGSSEAQLFRGEFM